MVNRLDYSINLITLILYYSLISYFSNKIVFSKQFFPGVIHNDLFRFERILAKILIMVNRGASFPYFLLDYIASCERSKYSLSASFQFFGGR